MRTGFSGWIEDSLNVEQCYGAKQNVTSFAFFWKSILFCICSVKYFPLRILHPNLLRCCSHVDRENVYFFKKSAITFVLREWTIVLQFIEHSSNFTCKNVFFFVVPSVERETRSYWVTQRVWMTRMVNVYFLPLIPPTVILKVAKLAHFR